MRVVGGGGGRCGSALKSKPLPFYKSFFTGIQKVPLSYIYLLLTDGSPFTYLGQNFVSLLTAMMNKITKPEGFLNFFTAMKCIFQPFWAFLQTEMTGLLILSYTSTSEIPTLSYWPEAWKRYSFGAEPPCITV